MSHKLFPCNQVIITSRKEKDLGIIVDGNIDKMLYPVATVMEIIVYVDQEMVKNVMTSIIGPTLECPAVLWSPIYEGT